MLAKVLSSAVLGIDAYRVEVEVDINSGLPTFTMVGLPETSVKESKERVKSAINNSGYRFPDDRITVNLAPADIKKEGTGFDLPIALGILAATGIIPQNSNLLPSLEPLRSVTKASAAAPTQAKNTVPVDMTTVSTASMRPFITYWAKERIVRSGTNYLRRPICAGLCKVVKPENVRA